MSFFDLPRLSKYYSNTSWLVFERILRMVIALFIGIYVARYLGAERYGLLSYANSFVGLFIALSTLGLDAIVVRELVKNTERRNELLGTAFGLKIMGVILMWLAILVAVYLTDSDAQANTFIAIIAFGVIFQAFNVIDFNYQAEVKSKYVVHAQLAQLVISSICKLLLVFYQAPLIWFAWIYSLDAAVLALGLAIMYLRYTGKIIVWRLKWSVVKELLSNSWLLLLYAYFVTINMNIDIVMVKHILGNESAGHYSVAMTLSAVWYFLPVVIGSTFFPYIISRKSDPNYKKRVSSLFALLTLIALLGAIVVSSLSYWIVTMLYGYEYAEAANILSIHIWTGVFVFHVSIRSRMLISDNLHHFSMLFMLFGVIVNMIGNYILIPLYGGSGAAYASLISWAGNVLVFPLLNKNTRYFVKLFFTSPNELFQSKRHIR